jgi:hypothetical protein
MGDGSGDPPRRSALGGSVVVAFVSGLLRGLPSRAALVDAVRNSTLATLVRGSALFSALAGLRPASERPDRPTSEDQTRTADSAGPAADDGETATSSAASTPTESAGLLAGSGLARVAAWVRRLVTESWLYRWLTAEPDPDVVVIDLRETRTAGPILAVLDRVIGFAAGALPASRVGNALRACVRFVRVRPVQLGSVLLAAIAVVLALRTVVSDSPSPVLFAVVVVLAGVAALGSRITWSWSRVRESRVFRALAAAFEPPEPPDQ